MNFGSVDQLWRAVWQKEGSRSAKYAEERLRLLEKEGFIKRELMPGSKQRFFLCLKKGHDVFRDSDYVVPPIRKVNFGQFEHDNFLAELRLEFEKSGFVKKFESDRVLKAELFSGQSSRERSRSEGYHMVPDARMVGREGEVIWLEYDRTKKSYDRFKEKAFNFRERLRDSHKHLIWIVEDQGIFEVVREVIDLFRDDQVVLITKGEFLKAGASAVLSDLFQRKRAEARRRAEQEKEALRQRRIAEQAQIRVEIEKISREIAASCLELVRFEEELAALEKRFFRKRDLEAGLFFQIQELNSAISKSEARRENLLQQLSGVEFEIARLKETFPQHQREAQL
jgi:hypothetical protein